jgi:transcriptional regulator GlxA family with amidase domain
MADMEVVMREKIMAILAMPGVQMLDVSGPLDVFAEANRQLGRDIYRSLVIGTSRGPIRSSSAVQILPDLVIGAASDDRIDIDTLLVAGTPDAANTLYPARLVSWLADASRRSRRYGSVCSGALLLAKTGLLDGRHVTTHWAVADHLASAHPKIFVDKDAIHVKDGRTRTAAGVTAGMDLALALVEEDLGRDVATRVAGQLVMYFKRPGGQMQFSRAGQAAPVGRSALQEVQRWVAANPAGHHDVASLAKRMDLSPRHFARLFRAEVGMTPASWVEAARISAARTLLEQGRGALKQIAARSGFTDANTFRRAFLRHAGVSPAEYRKRYGGEQGRARASDVSR